MLKIDAPAQTSRRPEEHQRPSYVGCRHAYLTKVAEQAKKLCEWQMYKSAREEGFGWGGGFRDLSKF